MKQVIHICLFLIGLNINLFAQSQSSNGPVKIKIETTLGNMVAVLYDDTPLHRDNFVKNIKEGVYKDLLFHRVIKEFMIQGGDPDSKNAPAEKVLGNGSLGYTIPAEFKTNHYHKKGVLAMARQGDDVNPKKESSSCQFYIVHGKVFEDNVLTMMEDRFNQQTRNQIFNEFLMKTENAEWLKKAQDA
ncbi:MAG: peptidylprolyl isomerase, partial [Flavobacteriales bacterium]|nr:peptidylprolyl isomerase [Flavobacteriales bacterium]